VKLRRRLSTPLAAGALAAFAALARADSPPHAPEPPQFPARLDLATALRLLRERGLDLLAAEAQVAAARGDLAAAGAIANPTLSAGYGRSHPRGSCTDATGAAAPCRPLSDPALSASLSDGNALFDALTGKRGLRVDVARAALDAARLSRDDALRSLEGQVKTAYAAVVLARATLDFAGEVADASNRSFELSRHRYEEGAISEADLARIETVKLEADQAVDADRASLRAAEVALAFLLGARGPVPDFEVQAEGFDRATVPPGLAREGRDALLERAVHERPDVLAAREQVARARAAAALARRQRIPDVGLSASYAQQGTSNTAVTPPTWTLGLSVPLPILYQQQGEIARAEAEASAQEIALARAEAQATSDVETAWAVYQGARAQAERMQGRLLDRARTAFDLVTVQYQKGAASLLDMLDARRTWIAARLEYYQDVGAYWAAVFRLEQAAGVALR